MKPAEPSTASRSPNPATKPRRRRSFDAAVILATSVVATVLTGCVQRTVTVTSEPKGALVWLNDREVGRTPVTVPFTFYGTYDVRLEADGHEPLWTTQEASPPWWEHPPIDLLGEAVGGDVELAWHFVLPQAKPTDDEATDRLIDHARQMRATLETAP